MNVDNYGITLVDLKNIGPWVLADRVAHVFYVLDPENEKNHVVISGKQRIVGVENVEDDDEDYNQYEEMTLFTNPMKMKRVEKTSSKKLMPYMRSGVEEKFV